jgi:predicted ester cyclase
MSSAEANKALVLRMHSELVEAADASRIDEYFGPGFVGHNMPLGLPSGREGVKGFLAMLREGLAEMSVTIDAILAEDDLVSVRSTIRGMHRGPLMGVPPSGRPLAIEGIDVVRIEDGLIVEHWGLTDMLGVMRQAGRLATLRGLARHLLGS